jgi:hypothetical protein
MELRGFQENAIESLISNIKKGKKSCLIQMTQGSGKSITCIASILKIQELFGLTKTMLVSDKKNVIKQLEYIYNQYSDSENDFLDYCTNKAINLNALSNYDLVVVFDMSIKSTRWKKFSDSFNGILVNFSSVINYEADENLVYRYTFSDALNQQFWSEGFMNDKSLQDIQKSFSNIESILVNNHKKSIDYNLLQKLTRETRAISNRLKTIYYHLSEDRELVNAIKENKIDVSEIKKIGQRKKELKVFEKFLSDEQYFEESKIGLRGDEIVWQNFFERNNWILGYGLTQIFHSSLEGKKLEQIVSGFGLNTSGKRVDGLMKSKGIIESICFIELKTHKTKLLHSKSYRSECWQPSSELSGAVAQMQKTVLKARSFINDQLKITNQDGEPTGEEVYNYVPKSFLIIGSLSEFQTPNGVNKTKYASFEMYRKNIKTPEIITFDELYEKAKFIAK